METVNRKYRLLVYTTQMLPTGGIESHLRQFLCHMENINGISIDLVVLHSEQMDEQVKYLNSLSRKALIGRRKITTVFKLLLFLISNRWTKYDALYTNGQGDSVYWIGKIFRFKRWIHHHHTSGDLDDQATWTAKYTKALTGADEVIACSTKNARDIAAKLEREVISVPCFSTDMSFKKRVNVGKLCFGYYGRLIPEKGIDLICKLSEDKELSHIQFLIWGEGEQYPQEYFDNFSNLIYRGTFRGKEELGRVLETLDAYLLLSTHPEGLPISLLELMSAGIPWVATNKGGISDIANDPLSTRLIRDVSDYEEIKRVILSLADDLIGQKIDGNKQINLYQTYFSPMVLTEKWVKVLFE